MDSIWKYPIKTDDSQRLEMPLGAEILVSYSPYALVGVSCHVIK
ncbi:hypothetical protein [Roseivirga pacifica]|nr:hypothetical protein [Roseivirga pacifica]